MGVVSPMTAATGFWNCTAIARRTGLAPRTIRRYLEQGLIPGAMQSPGGHWRVPTAALELFLRQLQLAPTG
jgi:excisionase family DNA binding protein